MSKLIEAGNPGQDYVLRQEQLPLMEQNILMDEIQELSQQPGFEIFANIREVKPVREKSGEPPIWKEGSHLPEFLIGIVEQIRDAADAPTAVGKDFFIGVFGDSGAGKSETAAAIIELLTTLPSLSEHYQEAGARLAVWNLSLGSGMVRARQADQIPPDLPFHRFGDKHYEAATKWMIRGAQAAAAEKPDGKRITNVIVADTPAHFNPFAAGEKRLPHTQNLGTTLYAWMADKPTSFFVGIPSHPDVYKATLNTRTAVNQNAENKRNAPDYRRVMRRYGMHYDIPTPPAAEIAYRSANPAAMKKYRRLTNENMAAVDPTELYEGEEYAQIATAEELAANPALRQEVQTRYMHYIMKQWKVPQERYLIGWNPPLHREHTHMLGVLGAHRLRLERVNGALQFDYPSLLDEQEASAAIRREERKRWAAERTLEDLSHNEVIEH